MAEASPSQERLLVLMPNPRDAERTIQFLCTSGIGCVACPDMQTLCREIEASAGAALLTEEAILNDHERCLVSVLEREPPWSNFPLIVLTAPGGHGRHLGAGDLLNITLVERPVRFLTLNSVVAAALRHRRHQYEIRDTLSELKQTQTALQTANWDLEDRVRDRTARLTEALRELESFSYSIAHDMRAPLRAMRGFARILQEDYAANLPEKGQMYLQKIEDGSTRMDHLIKDILEYSRVARADLRPEPLDLQPILEEIATSLSTGTSRTRAIEISPPFPTVVANRAAFTQAASNLISNALKFVPAGRPPHVKISAQANSNGRVRVLFQDNGIGIPEKHQKQIFGIFQRLHLDSAYEGTGIGLAIVRKAMERMGGEVGLESEPGKGSTFWLDLPAAS